MIHIIQDFDYISNSDDEKFTKLLINAGANVNHIDNNGGSVMHWAAHKSSDKLANLLIRSGAKDVSAQDHTGKTPLYYAKLTGDSMNFFSQKKNNTNCTHSLNSHFYSIYIGNSKFEEALLKFITSESPVMPQINVELLLLAIGVCFIVF